jgi:hypothetical protein
MALETKTDTLQLIERERKYINKQMPNYPDHIAAKAGLVSADAGFLMQLCLDKKYENRSNSDIEKIDVLIRQAAIRVAAQTLRFIENIDKSQ